MGLHIAPTTMLKWFPGTLSVFFRDCETSKSSVLPHWDPTATNQTNDRRSSAKEARNQYSIPGMDQNEYWKCAFISFIFLSMILSISQMISLVLSVWFPVCIWNHVCTKRVMKTKLVEKLCVCGSVRCRTWLILICCSKDGSPMETLWPGMAQQSSRPCHLQHLLRMFHPGKSCFESCNYWLSESPIRKAFLASHWEFFYSVGISRWACSLHGKLR